MSECKFFIPGPTWVRPAILQEMTRPMIGHRSAEFRELFGGIRRDLKTLFELASAPPLGEGVECGNQVTRRERVLIRNAEAAQ